jgi:NADPH:quinone reductase-like Zn-dependent oxidoreductase
MTWRARDFDPDGFRQLSNLVLVSSNGAQWIIFGVRSTRQMPMPVEHLWPMIEKNITLRGFNLEGSLQHVPRALGDLFKWVAEGTIKLQIKKYPLQDAAAVHELFAARKSTGKVVLIPT